MVHGCSSHSEETVMGNGEDFGFILGKRGNGWVIVRRVAARNDPAVLNPASFPVVVGTIFTWNFTSALLQVCATYQVACPRAPLNLPFGTPPQTHRCTAQ